MQTFITAGSGFSILDWVKFCTY